MSAEPKTDHADEVLGIPQAARIIGTAESTLRYWRHLGIGPKSFKIGRRVKYLKSDLDAYIEQSRAAD